MMCAVRRLFFCAVMLCGGSAFTDLAAAASSPTTLTFELREAGGGVGYNWGHGILHYAGKDYAFRISGGGLASLGYARITGHGRVKDLTSLSNFDGTYWTVGADAAVGGGSAVTLLENQFGVRVKLYGPARGVHLGAAVKRLRLKLLPPYATDPSELR